MSDEYLGPYLSGALGVRELDAVRKDSPGLGLIAGILENGFMLIRWASERERRDHGFDPGAYGEYDVLIAVDRMSGDCLGITGFSREEKWMKSLTVLDKARKAVALLRRAEGDHGGLHGGRA